MTSAYPATRGARPPLAGHWTLTLVLGLLTAGVGLLLLLNLPAAARTLALLIALGLVLDGVASLLSSDPAVPRWASLVSGSVLVLGGIVAAAWPGVTLWVVALVVGTSLLVSGGVKLAMGVGNRREPGAGFVIVGGVLTLLAAVAALVWPHATILVLSIVLGARIFVIGLLTIAVALELHRMGPVQA